ncbi:MAG: hypothetical protein NC548_45010 [Lachnospiraceae bacterium]|nr:hypothetical protein [Lachnospiraceae bacterium]
MKNNVIQFALRKNYQYASRGMLETVDNLVLQQLIKMAEDAKIKNEEMLVFQLNKCEFSKRQRIFFDCEDVEDRENMELCMFCQKPVNEVAVVYQYVNDEKEVKRLFCLEREGEELL